MALLVGLILTGTAADFEALLHFDNHLIRNQAGDFPGASNFDQLHFLRQLKHFPSCTIIEAVRSISPANPAGVVRRAHEVVDRDRRRSFSSADS